MIKSLGMLNLEIPDQKAESHRSRRRIRRLPSVLRENERFKHNYSPKVISLGPFHHGKAELRLGQTFKHKAMETFLSTSGRDKLFFYEKIITDVDGIRTCYDDVSCDELDDEALAEMMMLDGCFVVSLMEILSDPESLQNVLSAIGMAGFSFAVRDVFLLENQIPYRVVSLLMKLRYDLQKGEDLLENFLNYSAFHRMRHGSTRDHYETEPLHLLEAIRRKLVLKPPKSSKSRSKKHSIGLKIEEEIRLGMRIYTSRSVSDLKSKGIHFKPSSTACLRDVKFSPNFIFYGNLELPTRCISEKTKVLFTNLVAYEMSPDNASDFAISSYVQLMKSLIHTAKDVKELREKRVLISNLGSDDEVFRVLKEIGTCETENAGIFDDVKERIEEHYNNKAKTWMAELLHNYFESPWTAIALLAAILLLILTFLQTVFTVHPWLY